MSFGVSSAARVNNVIFWVVTPCRLRVVINVSEESIASVFRVPIRPQSEVIYNIYISQDW